MKPFLLILLLTVLAFIGGFYIRHLLPEGELPGTRYSCQSIAREYQDYLMWKYRIDPGFNTDQNNPRRDVNQKASDLTTQLLRICDTSPLEK
jgi:hypothetical protein